ncbi:MAG: 2-amino-4-hydroxy-6-hydroxymethyldihydropteridine diphosphokinase [Candidatus Loosdrechtia sp.]|uniref:2-amino-4-hydroxy-6- hydroxymethyldihydropteridine diphosphokinase n=1 Tax=Candidatus Loosdrechtia sp. TaxID=3101272 RepID=UPI003A6F101A|nr:MAG: 2-amino-4-hydroxy-6-hydroxymethyldihydropteridine diphosphokinase [Candidatus Jettenia sp. AMX2]
MVHVCIGLGSNMGDRAGNLLSACDRIRALKEVQFLKLSKFYETLPAGGPPQPRFLNAALSMRTSLLPFQLLEHVQHIEMSMGRIRTIRWGPRNIDIDILLYGDQVVEDDQLKIPHPFLHIRSFVLEPLAEIDPHIVHPVLKKTIFELYKELQQSKL